MQLQQVTHNDNRLRMALMGLSGSGKTYSSLLLAFGMCGDWSKIAVIDTEVQGASLYANLGPFSTVQLGPPYQPTRYFEAFDLCQDSGKEVVIIDSLSPEWIGEGGVRDGIHGAQYQELLRDHRALLALLSRSTCHVITTIRTKRCIVTLGSSGKRHPKLIQLPLQQQGIEYPFTTVLQLDNRNRAHVIKDLAGVLTDKPPLIMNAEVGGWYHKWSTKEDKPYDPVLQRKIDACQSIAELHRLLVAEEVEDVALIGAFTTRRLELEGIIEPPFERTKANDSALPLAS